MLEVLDMLLNGGLIFAICYISNIAGKCFIAYISKSNKVSDNKAKAFTKMMSKDINIDLHH